MAFAIIEPYVCKALAGISSFLTHQRIKRSLYIHTGENKEKTILNTLCAWLYGSHGLVIDF
ncbi:hypothetical protein CZ787_05935 [Halomonas citrativorans]|uniref:Uncharacterized protein n=1 Tax=Halomonas citrativorans TaxID=2742612 RepID=A0A1R4HVG5_9GAMM|nr:hypothetical protein CZ787_05935 [Halomonas citrativorans]